MHTTVAYFGSEDGTLNLVGRAANEKPASEPAHLLHVRRPFQQRLPAALIGQQAEAVARVLGVSVHLFGWAVRLLR
jgi:hypothetical protein